MDIGLERFVQVAAAVLDIEPEQLVPAIKVSLAESALAAPFASFGDHDFYPDPITRAAVLASRIMRNHPLPDGDKRVALVLMDVYLQGRGFEFEADPNEVDENLPRSRGTLARRGRLRRVAARARRARSSR